MNDIVRFLGRFGRHGVTLSIPSTTPATLPAFAVAIIAQCGSFRSQGGILIAERVTPISDEFKAQIPTQSVFVTAHIDVSGRRGPLIGGAGKPAVASGSLLAPRADVVLWRIMERVEIEQRLVDRKILPAEDGLSATFAYTVAGGGGGLFSLDEPGRYKGALIAVFAPPSYLPSIGAVEILTSRDCEQASPTGGRLPPDLKRTRTPSIAQLNGRLFRAENDGSGPVYFVQHGSKRRLESTTVGKLRFGDGWRRLVQILPDADNTAVLPDGPPLGVAEAAEGKLIACFPDSEYYLVMNGERHAIENEEPVIGLHGPHWRIKLFYLRRSELDVIPKGSPIRCAEDIR